MLDQGDQHIKGATAETNRSVTSNSSRRAEGRRKGPNEIALERSSGDVNQFNLTKRHVDRPCRRRQSARHSPKRENAA
jgi:hypothetical protein